MHSIAHQLLDVFFQGYRRSHKRIMMPAVDAVKMLIGLCATYGPMICSV